MAIDSEPRNPQVLLPAGDLPADGRRGPPSQWDMGLQRGLTRLDINTPPRDGADAWAREANQALLVRAEQARAAPSQPVVRFEQEVQISPGPPTALPPSTSAPMLGSRHQYTMSAPSISAPRESRRHGWYHGPASHPVGETIHEGRPHVDRIVHPNVRAFQGFPAREQQPVIHQQPSQGMERILERPGGNSDAMRRLEALVAVATSESSTATAY